jgi:predicted dehydrogenase
MSKPVGLALIGCGAVAQSGHLPAVARHPGARLRVVADIAADQARTAGARYGVPALTNYREALAWPGVDAVIIATPPEVTPRITLDAVAAGKDVLCEKPLAVDLMSAEQVDAAARQARRIVQIGFKNRFAPLVRTLRRWIVERRLGAPLAFTLGAYDEPYDPADASHYRRIVHFLDHGPSMIHEGAHLADFLHFLSNGRPVQITATALRSRPEFPSENFVAALITFDNGDVARVEVGWLFPHILPGDFRVWGPEGVAELNRAARLVQLRTQTGLIRETMDSEWNSTCFDAQLTCFLDCIATRQEPETGMKAGIASLQLTIAIAQACRTGQPATLGAPGSW